MSRLRQQHRMLALALAVHVHLAASTAHADVYPSGLRFPDADRVITGAESCTIEYILNENADGDHPDYDFGVRIRVLRACDGAVTREVKIPQQTRGRQSFTWDKLDNTGQPAPDGSYRFEIAAADAGHSSWEMISTDTVATNFHYPSGVAVNRRPESEFYGRLYVTSATTTTTALGRPQGRGLYLLNADLTDAEGQGNAARSGGVPWNNSNSSPFRPEVGPDDRVYIADWSDQHAGLWVADPRITSATRLLADVGAVASTGLSGIHGSIADCVVTGLGTGRIIYTLDADFLGFGVSGTGPAQGSIWKYADGNTTPTSGPPTVVYDDSAGDRIQNYRNSLARANDDTWWISQEHDAGTGLASLTQISADGTTVLWDSKSYYVTQLGHAQDDLRQTRGIAYDSKYNRIALATYRHSGSVATSEGLVIIFNAATREIESSFRFDPRPVPTTFVFNSDVAFDAVGNVYVTSTFVNGSNPGIQRLRAFSPPTGKNASTTLSPPIALTSTSTPVGPVLAGPADITTCAGVDVAFTVAATGTGTLTYRWFENGVELPGIDSSTLHLGPAATEQSGLTYSVQVCDELGQATSRTALLSVGNPPLIDMQPQSIGVWAEPPETAKFTVKATSRGAPPIPLIYQWKKLHHGVETEVGTNAASLVLENVPYSDHGAEYYVVVTDPSCGTALSVTSQRARLNVLLPCPTPFGDADFDGDVDQTDFGALQQCWGTFDAWAVRECRCFDRAGGVGSIGPADLDAFAACVSGPAIAAEANCGRTILFQDGFDDAQVSAASWTVNKTPPADYLPAGTAADATVTFAFDYGKKGLPRAPHAAKTTKGLFVSVNDRDDDDPATPDVNDDDLLEAALAFTNLAFSGDYTVEFDMWAQYAVSGEEPDTEFSAFGVNAQMTGHLIRPVHRQSAVDPDTGPHIAGYLFAVDGEAGDAFRDYRTYGPGVADNELLGAFAGFADGNQDASTGIFPALFPAPRNEFVGVPGNSLPARGYGWGWVHVRIQHHGGQLTWRLNDHVVATGISSIDSPSGSIMLGHMDLDPSVSSPNTWTIFDNLLVSAP